MLAEILLSAGILVGGPADGQTYAVATPCGKVAARAVVERFDREGQVDGSSRVDDKQIFYPPGEFC